MTVFQINTKWYYRFKIKGKEYYKSVPEAVSKKDAEKAEARVKSELLQGKYSLVDNVGEMFFKDLKEKYLKYSENNKLSWKSDVSRLNHLADFFCNKKLKEINSFEVERYKIERLKQKTYRKELVSNTTVNREIEVLRNMFNIAVENRWMNTNPASSTKVKKLRQDNKIERFLQPNEEQELFKKCVGRNAHLRPIIIMALHTAMRRGEILNLTWASVDLKRRYITLTKTKNGKIRKIPISDMLYDELSILYKKSLSEFVFTNPRNKKNYTDIKKSFKSVCDAAKVAGLRFHDLRHTAATRMVSAGIDLVVVQEILGHEDLKTTQRYSHPVPERKFQAIQALNNFSKARKKVIKIVNQK